LNCVPSQRYIKSKLLIPLALLGNSILADVIKLRWTRVGSKCNDYCLYEEKGEGENWTQRHTGTTGEDGDKTWD
jgi:hypothetical protein